MIYRIINETVRANCLQEIKGLSLEKYQVSVTEIKRSNPQNNLYWKWLSIIGNDLGYTPDDLHEAMKANFLGTESGKDMFGNLYIRPKSSAKLKKKEFSDYMNKVHAFAMGEGIILPQPDYYGDSY